MGKAKPSEMDIKVPFPRRLFVYSLKNWMIHRWKILRISLINGRREYRMHDFSTKTYLIIIFMLILSWIILCDFYFFRNEGKLVALLVYSSFRRVSTSGIQNNSLATSSISWIRQAVLKWGVNTESLRIHHSTAARHSWNSINDVTRLVTTEHVRNKYALPESIFSLASHATSNTNLKKSTGFNCTYCNP